MSINVITGFGAGMLIEPKYNEHLGLMCRIADPAEPDDQYAIGAKGFVAVLRDVAPGQPPLFEDWEIFEELAEDQVCRLSKYLEKMLTLPPGAVNAENISAIVRALSLGYANGLVTGIRACAEQGPDVMGDALQMAILQVAGS